MKATIVMQGGIWPETLKVAKEYAEYFNVIISTMEGENINTDHDNIKIVKSPMPENRGQGNINLQIVSSLAGVKKVKDSSLVIKTRTDQQIDIATLYEMIEVFEQSIIDKDGGIDVSFIDNSERPSWYIYVLGNQSKFPFSSQDHLYIGFKEDLVSLFDIPLNTEPLTGTWSSNEWGHHQQADKGLDFNIHLRMPIYLGAMYYAKFYPEVKHFIEHWQEYLTDNAPKRKEAMKFYETVKDSVFKVLPKFENQIWWSKMACYYPYEMYKPQGEYYGASE